jgi:tetratricopeptide (TPR) repeat protein
VADAAAVTALLGRAAEAGRAGRRAEAVTLYRQVLQLSRDHVEGLRALRDLAVADGSWAEALTLQGRLVAVVPAGDRAREAEWLAGIHHELGRAALAGGAAQAAVAHFRSALKADRRFVPAAVALADAWEGVGDRREALRTLERTVEAEPALPLLARLERWYREEDRPSRMIALYREACERAPDDLALAVGLGRVLFELEMLDEAADHFEKLEVRAPGHPVVHAYLGAVFERRGQTIPAFEEYRRALRLAHAFDWPHRCDGCGATHPRWAARCDRCGRWNAVRPTRD